MRVIGLLSWYDEPPGFLATAVAGAARFCDFLVAVDGAYALYPRAKPRSHPSQAEAILHTAEALELGCLLYQPATTWSGNETQKRQACINLAGAFAAEDDWVFIFDADYHLRECNPELLRAELENTDLHVASYMLVETLPKDAPEVAHRAAGATEWTTPTRDVYRWNPTLTVWPAHYTYTAVIDGERKGLKGTVDMEECLELSGVSFYHRSQDRPKGRRDAQESYYRLRNELNIERADEVVEVPA